MTDGAAVPVAATNRELTGVGRHVDPAGAEAAVGASAAGIGTLDTAAALGVPAGELDAGGALGAFGAAAVRFPVEACCAAVEPDRVGRPGAGAGASGAAETALGAGAELVVAVIPGAGPVAAALGSTAAVERPGASCPTGTTAGGGAACGAVTVGAVTVGAAARGGAAGGVAGGGVCRAGGPVGPAAVDRRTTGASSRWRASLAARACTAAALSRGAGASLPAAETSA